MKPRRVRTYEEIVVEKVVGLVSANRRDPRVRDLPAPVRAQHAYFMGVLERILSRTSRQRTIEDLRERAYEPEKFCRTHSEKLLGPRNGSICGCGRSLTPAARGKRGAKR